MPIGRPIISDSSTTVNSNTKSRLYFRKQKPKYVQNLVSSPELNGSKDFGIGQGIPHCDICKYNRLSAVEERKVWKCTNCGRETPFAMPVRRANPNRLVTADKPDVDGSYGGRRTFVMNKANMRRDARYIDTQKRKKLAHSLDDELFAAGYTVVSTKETIAK